MLFAYFQSIKMNKQVQWISNWLTSSCNNDDQIIVTREYIFFQLDLKCPERMSELFVDVTKKRKTKMEIWKYFVSALFFLKHWKQGINIISNMQLLFGSQILKELSSLTAANWAAGCLAAALKLYCFKMAFFNSNFVEILILSKIYEF